MWLHILFVKHIVETVEMNKNFNLMEDVDPTLGNGFAFSRSFRTLLAETFHEKSRLSHMYVKDSTLGSVLGSPKTITDPSHKFSVHAAKVVPLCGGH